MLHYDVIVIGAGLSGIGAGVRLAHYGKRVRIFDKHALPGGLNSYYPRAGMNVDVGLHAMTNYASEGERSAPLNKLLRQLRVRRVELDLRPQSYSLVSFPGVSMRLENGGTCLEGEVVRLFPSKLSGYRALLERVTAVGYNPYDAPVLSARAVLAEYLGNSQLVEMLLCPVMFYGNPARDDMDFTQFAIMFQSIFLEGLCRPAEGMKKFITTLLHKYGELGGELSLGDGISAIRHENGHAVGVVDSCGEMYDADYIISCAGALETAALCGAPPPNAVRAGDISFVESIFNLKRHPAEYGVGASIAFTSGTRDFRFHPPSCGIDMNSHIFCMPGNFAGCEEIPCAKSIRVSSLTSPKWWLSLQHEEYRNAKADAEARLREALAQFAPNAVDDIVSCELFTPKTILRYTGHINGAIYGSPDKNFAGTTGLDNLFISGTDQGFLGIVGSLMSGIVVANNHILK